MKIHVTIATTAIDCLHQSLHGTLSITSTRTARRNRPFTRLEHLSLAGTVGIADQINSVRAGERAFTPDLRLFRLVEEASAKVSKEPSPSASGSDSR